MSSASTRCGCVPAGASSTTSTSAQRCTNRERVIADKTVLGTVLFPFRHVHLTEIDRERVVNPLMHLRPYDDQNHRGSTGSPSRTPPDGNRRQPPGGRRDDRRRHGRPAADARPRRVGRLPHSTRRCVRSSLVTAAGRVVWSRVAADFRRTEPPQQDFWHVYASGTYQNFPVFDHHYYWGKPAGTCSC